MRAVRNLLPLHYPLAAARDELAFSETAWRAKRGKRGTQSMSENPYESPRSAPSYPPKSGSQISAAQRLRAVGVCFGFLGVASFFSLMGYVWRHADSPWVNARWFQYLVMAGVAVIFFGGLASLVALVVGNIASTEGQSQQRSPATAPGNVRVPYGGWIVAGIIALVLCLLGWLASRDPLSIPAG